jgi:hypothetical protein
MRNTAIPILAALLLSAGCGEPESGDSPLPEGPIEVRRLVPDSLRCGHGKAENLVIRDAKAWAAIWSSVREGMVPAANPPAVDFTRQMVLAAFLGPMVGPPATVSISSAEREGDRIVVTVAVRHLTSGATTQRSSPCSIVTVPRSSLEVEWNVVEVGGASESPGGPDGGK